MALPLVGLVAGITPSTPDCSAKDLAAIAAAHAGHEPPVWSLDGSIGDSGCSVLFYVYWDEVTQRETCTRNTSTPCAHHAFWCRPAFALRLLRHRCRTRTLSSDVPVLVAHSINRALGMVNGRPSPYLMPGEDNTRNLFLRMPAAVRRHPSLFLFGLDAFWYSRWHSDWADGPRAGLWKATDWPTQAVAFHIEPQAKSCSLFVPSHAIIGAPYVGHWLDDGAEYATMLNLASRPLEVVYTAGIHGPHRELRQRLYDYCAKTTAKWLCWTGLLHGGAMAYTRRMRLADFCLSPHGDTPTRASQWDAVRRGCIPVFFSECSRATVSLDGYADFFPPDTGDAFGARTWSVQLDSREVMGPGGLDYMRGMLSNISLVQRQHMRRLMLRYAAAASWLGDSDAANSSTGMGTDALTQLLRVVASRHKGGSNVVPPHSDGTCVNGNGGESPAISAHCSVRLLRQKGSAPCLVNETFGMMPGDGLLRKMWIGHDCKGAFMCCGIDVTCERSSNNTRRTCACY